VPESQSFLKKCCCCFAAHPSVEDPDVGWLATLPLVTYQAGQAVLRAASTTGQLLILKEGKVA
jgi:hypothetical protein